MRLLELLDTSVQPYRWRLQDRMSWIALFQTPLQHIRYSAEFQYEGKGRWEMSFEIRSDELERLGLDSNLAMANTGTGEELAVLSTFMAIVRDFIAQQRPEVLSFAIDPADASRARLYQRMFRRVPGYELEKLGIDSYGLQEYRLVKIARAEA